MNICHEQSKLAISANILRDGYFMIKSSAGNVTVCIDSSNPLLNRVRTGHTRARTHLKNIGIESDNTCRHCNRHPESIKHKLLTCKNFLKRNLRSYAKNTRKM